MMDSASKRMNTKLHAFHDSKANLQAGKRTKSKDLVDDILDEILNNKRYDGFPELAGSYKTGVKIERPDEFDYTVSLKLPASHRVTSKEGVTFQYKEDDIDCHKSAAKRILDRDRDIKNAIRCIPSEGYVVVKLKENETKRFRDAVINDVLVPYEALVQFHEIVKKAVDDMDDDRIKVKSYARGPAISLIIDEDKIGHKISVDMVPVINIGEARSILREYGWPRKETKAWLSKSKIEEIKNTEIFLVPKGDKFWRQSFARCEDKILKDMDSTCKELLRICKRKLKLWKSKSDSKLKSISSYLLKTILLWLCEKLPDDEDWCKKKLSYLYYNFMAELKYCLKECSLGEYFLPSNNLLETKDKTEIKEVLVFVKKELNAMDSMSVSTDCVAGIADLCLSD